MLCEDPRLRQARTGLVVPRAVAEAHTRIVAKQRRAVPFSQAVQEVKATPLASPAFDLHGPGGRGYRLIERDISAVRARQIGTAGAMLGWDACGCGGDCGYRWYDAEKVALAAAVGLPTLRGTRGQEGGIALLRSDDGRDLLLLRWPARWAELTD